MINQPLLDYIKQQIRQGVSREQVKSSLIANGWLASDVEEGFNTLASEHQIVSEVPTVSLTQSPHPIAGFINPIVNKQPIVVDQKKQKSGTKIILVLILVMVLAGAGWFGFNYYQNLKINNQKQNVVSVNKDKVQAPVPIQPKPSFDMLERTVKLGQAFEQLKLTKTFNKATLISLAVDPNGQSGIVKANIPSPTNPKGEIQPTEFFFIFENESWKFDFIKTFTPVVSKSIAPATTPNAR